MKTQPPEALKQPRTGRGGRALATPTVSVGLPLCAVLAAGCPGVQVRPEPFYCPAGALAAMEEELGWVASDRFSLFLDDRHGDELLWFSAGAEVVGVVGKGQDNRGKAPPGTRFLGGKVYLIPETNRRKGYPAVVVKYERVKVPGKDELPVCVVAESTTEEAKGTAARADNRTVLNVVFGNWAP